jgi:putative membrane protein
MKIVLKILVSAFIVVALSNLLSGVDISGYLTGIFVAALLGLMNVFIKPILVLFTLPVTVVTFGLFLLVINAVLVLIVESLIDGFVIDGFWWALFFSVLLSVFQSILYSIFERSERKGLRLCVNFVDLKI